jgi:hypothetical protein
LLIGDKPQDYHRGVKIDARRARRKRECYRAVVQRWPVLLAEG